MGDGGEVDDSWRDEGRVVEYAAGELGGDASFAIAIAIVAVFEEKPLLGSKQQQ